MLAAYTFFAVQGLGLFVFLCASAVAERMAIAENARIHRWWTTTHTTFKVLPTHKAVRVIPTGLQAVNIRADAILDDETFWQDTLRLLEDSCRRDVDRAAMAQIVTPMLPPPIYPEATNPEADAAYAAVLARDWQVRVVEERVRS